MILGVDVGGRSADPSALVAVGLQENRLDVLGAADRPVDETYAALVEHVASIATQNASTSGKAALVVVDRTGLGRVVADLLRDFGVPALGITITAGSKAGGSWPNWSIPKPLLLHVARAGIESGEVAMPNRREHGVLARQLDSLTHKDNGRVEAAGSGHDDQALAWLMAVYAGQMLRFPGRAKRLGVRGGQVVAT